MSNSNKWAFFPKPNPAAALRVFCFHHSGGSAQSFYDWPANLPPTVETCMVQLPGRGQRIAEPFITRLLPLSGLVAQSLRNYLDKPFAFFGHSMGALLCFEVARGLRREYGLEPAHLFASATEAPHRQTQDEALSTLPRDALIKKLHEFNGVPREALENDELMDFLLPTIRADFELCESYECRPEAPLSCPITIYGGAEDHDVDRESLAAWSEVTTGASNMRIFPGGHFYIYASQSIFLQTFASDLLRLISRLGEGPRP